MKVGEACVGLVVEMTEIKAQIKVDSKNAFRDVENLYKLRFSENSGKRKASGKKAKAAELPCPMTDVIDFRDLSHNTESNSKLLVRLELNKSSSLLHKSAAAFGIKDVPGELQRFVVLL